MASEVVMPRLSDSMEEGTVLKWLVEVGGEVKRGQPLVEIETDKANMTHDADTDGVLLEVLAEEGDTLAVGEPIARVGDEGEKPEAKDEPEEEEKRSRRRSRSPRTSRPIRTRTMSPRPRRSRRPRNPTRGASASRPPPWPAGWPRRGAWTWPRSRAAAPAGGS